MYFLTLLFLWPSGWQALVSDGTSVVKIGVLFSKKRVQCLKRKEGLFLQLMFHFHAPLNGCQTDTPHTHATQQRSHFLHFLFWSSQYLYSYSKLTQTQSRLIKHNKFFMSILHFGMLQFVFPLIFTCFEWVSERYMPHPRLALPKRQHFFAPKINDARLHVCLKSPHQKNAHLAAYFSSAPPLRCLFSPFQRPISEVRPPIFVSGILMRFKAVKLGRWWWSLFQIIFLKKQEGKAWEVLQHIKIQMKPRLKRAHESTI